jgi:AraC-like DNA-binding protein
MSMIDRIVFTTDDFPERKRFSAYREELAKWSCGLDLSTDDPSRFHAHLELRRAGAVDIMINTLSAMDIARSARLLRDGDDALMVMLLLRGQAQQSSFGERYNLNAGDFIICDSGYPGEFNLVAESKLLSLKIPRSKLSTLLPNVSRFAGARLDGDPVARRLLSNYLAGTLDVDLSGSLPAAQLHQDHIVDLVALALGPGGEMRELAERRGAQAVRRTAVIREIETSMADPAFDAAVVAMRLGITVRYVHFLLEATGRTFSEHLLDKRLSRTVELLHDVQHWPRRIADIAFEVGFKDLSYFNRMFRRKYGATPSDIRHAAILRHHGPDNGEVGT